MEIINRYGKINLLRKDSSNHKINFNFSIVITMKKLILTLCTALSLNIGWAQEVTTKLTLLNEFKPAIIHLASGNVNHSLTNVSLKNAALLYLSGTYTMEANMDNVLAVEMDGHSFVKIEKKLAECLDTIGDNQLFCTTLIDIPAYEQLLKNNKNITNLDFSNNMTSYTTIDIDNEIGSQLPVIRIYYYRYKGKIFRVHEREIWNRLPKEKRHIYKSIIALPDFSWTDRKSIVQLLKAISD